MNDASPSMPISEPDLSPALMTWIQETWSKASARVIKNSERIGSSFPHVCERDRYDAAAPHWWTAGFWPGMLWLVYRETGDKALSSIAEACEAELDDVLMEYDHLWHDVGFMWSLTSVAHFRLLKSEKARRRALIAASILSARFNLRGQFIRAWNESHTGWAIIDCVMNLPLLYWASEMTKDPRFGYIATAHADTVLAHFAREDGSFRHIVSFDPKTGKAIEALGGQGLSADSAWARGCAWAIYGLALTYGYTRESRFLRAATKAARFFRTHLPADLVPFWDFRAPQTSDSPRDSSAAACAASGMLELARLTTGEESKTFRADAVAILRALDEHCTDWNSDAEALLHSGAGNVPEGQNINVGLIYGDYFFLEALAKLRGFTEVFW